MYLILVLKCRKNEKRGIICKFRFIFLCLNAHAIQQWCNVVTFLVFLDLMMHSDAFVKIDFFFNHYLKIVRVRINQDKSSLHLIVSDKIYWLQDEKMTITNLNI